MKKLKTIALGAIAVILVASLAFGGIFDAYTFLWSRTWKACGFDGIYTYQEDGETVVAIFEGDEMALYTISEHGMYSSRIEYEFYGTYYNKGLFGRFLTQDKKWIEISNAEKAGEFYADCQTCVTSSVWGDIEYLDEADIDKRGEENGVQYSKTFYFTVDGGDLSLVLQEGEESFCMTMKKERVLTGDTADTVEHLDALWEYEFG